MNSKTIVVIGGMIFGFVFLLMLSAVLILLFLGGMSGDGLQENEIVESSDNYSKGEGLSKEVLSFEDDISDELKNQKIDQKYLPVLLGILQQESGGNEDTTDGDIFQSSESKCGEIGCITNTDESIEQAVKHLKSLTEQTDDVETVVQAYNFGSGYIDFVEGKSEKKHSKENAVEFSQKMMSESDGANYSCVRAEAREHSPPACYGDILYTETVMGYVDVQTRSVGGGEGLVVGDMALPLDEKLFENNMNGGIGSYSGHPGYDFTVPMGTAVYSIVDGEVVESVSDRPNYPSGRGLAQVLASNDLGNYIRIKPDDSPELMVNYMHLNTKENGGNLVKEGDRVEKGEQIGAVGNSGKTTAPHLHLDVLKNNVYDTSHAVHWYEELLKSFKESGGEKNDDDDG